MVCLSVLGMDFLLKSQMLQQDISQHHDTLGHPWVVLLVSLKRKVKAKRDSEPIALSLPPFQPLAGRLAAWLCGVPLVPRLSVL